MKMKTKSNFAKIMACVMAIVITMSLIPLNLANVSAEDDYFFVKVECGTTAVSNVAVDIKPNGSENFAESNTDGNGIASFAISGAGLQEGSAVLKIENSDYAYHEEEITVEKNTNSTAKKVIIKSKESFKISSITGNPTDWTKENVNLEIQGNEFSSYKKDNDDWKSTKTFTIEDNGTYTFYAKDNDGNFTEGKEITVEKIDKVSPEITSVDFDNTFSNQGKEYTVNATDDDSGIAAYSIDSTADDAWKESTESSYTFENVVGKKHTFYVKDNAGNTSKAEVNDARYDAKKPEITSVDFDNTLSNGEKTYTVNAKDNEDDDSIASGIVAYSIDSTADDAWKESNEFENVVGKKHKFYVKDKAGNISEAKETNAKYDEKLPELSGVTFSQENDDPFSKVLNILTFGSFFNEKLVITVNAKDEADDNSVDSGISKCTLEFKKGNEVIKTETKEWAEDLSFSINYDEIKNFKGLLSVTLTDKADNSSTTVVTNENSNLSKTTFMLENTSPIISDISCESNKQENSDEIVADESNDKTYFKENFNVGFNVKDEAEKEGDEVSGVAGVQLMVNGTSILNTEIGDAICSFDRVNSDDENASSIFEKNYNFEVELPTTKEDRSKVIINEQEVTVNKDGSLEFTVNAYDNAGNAAQSVTKTVYIDQTAPYIAGFDFSLDKNIRVEKDNDLYKAVQSTDYGFYFKKDVTVTVTAIDPKVEYEDNSGVKSITFKYVDVNEKETVGEEVVDETGKASFEVKKNFKGQIFVYATDNVGNAPNNATFYDEDKGTKIDNEGFVHPNGTILEDMELHKNSSISIIEIKLEDKSDCKDINNKPLYNKDVRVKVTVKDSYSGIQAIDWDVKSKKGDTDKKSITGRVNVDNSGKINGDTNGWEKAKKAKSDNLVNEMTKDFIVDINDNDITFKITLTDNAGNTSTEKTEFSIDKTKPEITVDYIDGKNNNPTNQEYFQKSRKAKIVVKERNFKNLSCLIKKSEAKAGSKYKDFVNYPYSDKNITTLKPKGKGDNTIHAFIVNFNDEGHYKFSKKDVSCQDLADNNNKSATFNGKAPHKFTIDKTNPKIEITYNPPKGYNGNYFKETRTATVKVFEHNFNEKNSIISVENGTKGEWKSNGDVHILTLTFTGKENKANSCYFSVNIVDLSGRKDSKNSEKFAVDKVPPVLSFYDGNDTLKDNAILKNNSISVKYTDVNPDNCTVKLYRNRVLMQDSFDVNDEPIIDVSNQPYIIQSGTGTIKINIPEKDEKGISNDGIYTLAVTSTDKATNPTNKTMKFMVNRFGSVYTFNDALIKTIENKYNQKVESNLIITEYNTTKLSKLSYTVDYYGNQKEKKDESNKGISTGNKAEWYEFDHVISKSLFDKDGLYKITLNSLDKNNNKSSNNKYEKSQVGFIIDSTKPEFVSIKGLENATVNATNQEVTVTVKDTIGLKSIVCKVNDKVINNPDISENEYSVSFNIPEGLNQKVEIIVTDMAGNRIVANDEQSPENVKFNGVITVSTNFFVRWYSRTVLFWCSIAALALLLALGLFFIAKAKMKNENFK